MNSTLNKTSYYRYRDFYYNTKHGSEIHIYAEVYFPVRETPKGVWIALSEYSERHLILHDALRKYAYPTQEEAWSNYFHRKEKQHSIVEAQAERCRNILKSIKKDTPVTGLIHKPER